jgi:transposase-like protein
MKQRGPRISKIKEIRGIKDQTTVARRIVKEVQCAVCGSKDLGVRPQLGRVHYTCKDCGNKWALNVQVRGRSAKGTESTLEKARRTIR